MPTVKEIAKALDATIMAPCITCGSTTAAHDAAKHNKADGAWLGDGPLNLVQKLAKIRRELKRIEKKGHNDHFGYDFMRAQDVAGDIGDRLAESNIILARENLKCETVLLEKGGVLNVVTCDYVFVDGDSDERLTISSCGTGYDSTDKGSYKAMTGALKYALTQALCMRVGDDPEEESGGNKSGGGNAPKERVVPVEDKDIEW